MNESDERIYYLIDRFFRNACTGIEKKELAHWIEKSRDDKELKHHLAEIWNRFEPMDDMSEVKADEMFSSIIKSKPTIIRQPVNNNKRIFLSRVAAASVVLILGVGIYFLSIKKWQHNREAILLSGSHKVLNDIIPGQSKAVLTLSDGSQIVLDTAGNGILAEQGNSKVINKNGQLLYNSNIKATNEMLYNTLATHRGEQYPMTLSDGTKVWLNAASSIRFPVAFNGKQRVVEITGEVYFEVVHNAKIPFSVKVGDEIIEDVGTHFNINAYQDEAAVKTTVIEGSVKVILGSSNVFLKPDEQAVLLNGSTKISVSPTNGEAAIAWKNGFFELTNADVSSIMRQVSRWYDVEIVYKGDVPKGTISGEVPRNLNLSEILKVLTLSGIHCEVEGKKLIVFDKGNQRVD